MLQKGVTKLPEKGYGTLYRSIRLHALEGMAFGAVLYGTVLVCCFIYQSSYKGAATI